jgi:hypothetical protein
MLEPPQEYPWHLRALLRKACSVISSLRPLRLCVTRVSRQDAKYAKKQRGSHDMAFVDSKHRVIILT